MPFRGKATPLWLWPNILSLDAPVVALVWQDFLHRCNGASLRLPGRAVLGLTVWAIYLADRLIDTRHPHDGAASEEDACHRFYRSQRGLAILLLSGVTAADVLAALLWLRPEVFSNGLAAGAGVAVYLMVFAHLRWSARVWKHGTAAVLFTIGTFLVSWTNGGGSALSMAMPFGGLCFANLMWIEHWEAGRPSRHQAPLWWFAAALAAGPLLVAWLRTGEPLAWHAAIVLAAAGLAAVDFAGTRIASFAIRRVLADAVLLSPLLILAVAGTVERG